MDGPTRLPADDEAEALVLWQLLIGGPDRDENVRALKRLRQGDFVEPFNGELFVRLKERKTPWRLDKLLRRREVRIFTECVALPAGRVMTFWWCLDWYVERLRRKTVARGKILAAEKALRKAYREALDA